MEDWIEKGVVTGYVYYCMRPHWYCLYDETARLSRFTLVNFNSVLAYAESTLQGRADTDDASLVTTYDTE